MTRLELPLKPRILVIVLRRLGDVLLTTPLMRSIRVAWPDATIDALVFASAAGVLDGNPDLNRVVMMPDEPSAMQSLTLAARLWRRYDLAISTQAGDRPTFFAIAAARTRVAPVETTFGGRLKRLFLRRAVVSVIGIHRVEEILRLVDVLDIERVPQIVCAKSKNFSELPFGDYAVIHAAPMYRYKQWTATGWREIARILTARGLTVVATGGPGKAERGYLDNVWNGMPVHRLDGRLSWPQLGEVLSNARIYIGPDTSVTHLAAASGCPTVALYGPTDPRLWGPWPFDGLPKPWNAAGRVQRRGNVCLVQNVLPCMPCQLEGCERRLDGYSACLDELLPQQAIAAVEQVLG